MITNTEKRETFSWQVIFPYRYAIKDVRVGERLVDQKEKTMSSFWILAVFEMLKLPAEFAIFLVTVVCWYFQTN